ncbi:MAG: TIGR02996 domain-containing protein [Gemmataceae bacterium]
MTLPAHLLAPILAAPHGDLSRLIAADWLDEHDSPKQAEFIRVQIANPTQTAFNIADTAEFIQLEFGLHAHQVLYRRGWPDEIRCTMAQWVGERCIYCTDGYIHNDMHYSHDTCSMCHGKGRKKGIAGRVMASWPVTTVVLTDRKPAKLSGSKEFTYWRESLWGRPHLVEVNGTDGNICDELFDVMKDMFPNCLYGRRGLSSNQHMSFKTESAAHAAASAAAIEFGRRETGLNL